jgi:hypothetical protein
MTMLSVTTQRIIRHAGFGAKLAEMTEGKPILFILVLVGLVALYFLCCALENK